MTLTQAEMEAKYDAERSAAAYTKPAGDLITATLEYLAEVERDDEMALADEIDRLIAEETPLSPGEEKIINLILAGDKRVIAALRAASLPEATDDMISILEEIDGGERSGIDARFDRCIDAVAELPDAQRAQAIALWEGFLSGVVAA
jgi:hypothetical protein